MNTYTIDKKLSLVDLINPNNKKLFIFPDDEQFILKIKYSGSFFCSRIPIDDYSMLIDGIYIKKQ